MSLKSEVTIFHRQVLDRYAYLTDEVWISVHFSQTSFGLVSISDSLVLDRKPYLTAKFWTWLAFFTDNYYEDFEENDKNKGVNHSR